MNGINWNGIFNNIFTSGVNGTKEDEKTGNNTQNSSGSSSSSGLTTSEISDIFGEAFGSLIGENIPDTANTAKEAVEYFSQNAYAYLESREDAASIATSFESAARSYINNYVKENPNGPYDISAIFNEFKIKMEEEIQKNEEATIELEQKTEGLKNNVDTNFETLITAYNEAYGDNGYINPKEYKVIIDIAVDYLLGQLLNGNAEDAFFEGINSKYKNNTNYRNALIYIEKYNTAQNTADKQKHLDKAESELRKFLGERNVGGSSKIQTAIEQRQRQIFLDQCGEQIDSYINECCEDYDNEVGDTEGAEEKVKAYKEKMYAIKEAFINQYEGETSEARDAFADYVEKVLTDSDEISQIINSYKSSTTQYDELLNAVNAAGNYIDKNDEEPLILDKAYEYILGDIIKGNSNNMLVALGFKNNKDYKEALKLLENIESSITPKEDYEKATSIIKSLIEEAGAESIMALVDAYEEQSNVDLDKNPEITSGLIENTIGEDKNVSLLYTIKNEKVVWENEDLTKVFKELESRIKAAMKEQLGSNYNSSQVSEWFNCAIMMTLNEAGNIRNEISISSFVQEVLGRFDSVSTMALKVGNFEQTFTRALEMAEETADYIAAEDAQKLEDLKKAEEVAQKAVETAQDAVEDAQSALDKVNNLSEQLQEAIDSGKSASEITNIANQIIQAAAEAHKAALNAKKAATEAQNAAAAQQSSAEIQKLAQEAEKAAVEANNIDKTANNIAIKAQNAANQVQQTEEAKQEEAEKNLRYGQKIDAVIQKLLADNDWEGSDEDLEATLQKAKIEFIKQFQGDEANIEAEFETYANNIVKEYNSTNRSIDALFKDINTFCGIEYGVVLSLGNKYDANKSLSEKDEQNFMESCYKHVMLRLANGKNADFFYLGFPLNLDDNESYKEAMQLWENINTSLTPAQDWAKIQELIKTTLEDMGVEGIMENVNSRRVHLDESVLEGINGYKNNNTYGNDDMMCMKSKFENGTVTWTDTDQNGVNENNIIFSQLRENIRAAMKEQFGSEYDAAAFEKYFNMALCETAKEYNDTGNVQVEKVLRTFLEKFNSIMTRSMNEDFVNQSGYVDLSNDLSITDGVFSYLSQDTTDANGGKDDYIVVRDWYTIGTGEVVSPNENDGGEIQKIFDTLRENIHERLQKQLGDKYDADVVTKCINEAMEKIPKDFAYLGDTTNPHVWEVVDKFLEHFDTAINRELQNL